jgi:hypothetical protein
MITLIWNSNKETGWEVDWIEYLFEDIPHRSITDYGQTDEIDRAIFCIAVFMSRIQPNCRLPRKQRIGIEITIK